MIDYDMPWTPYYPPLQVVLTPEMQASANDSIGIEIVPGIEVRYGQRTFIVAKRDLIHGALGVYAKVDIGQRGATFWHYVKVADKELLAVAA